ncbi:FAD-dependent monooxygenase [Actinoplanes sp. NPDC051633]|uniref:FAD-dependent monooxygenase n=1 Tax=Actinoplanes sp. NPDC051633 TaxID=3155670 RepID=UPI003433358D
MSVLVVGAGPTGLALAVGLLEGGAQVRIVDAAAGPATTSRALGLQPRGLDVLERLGALGDLTELGLQIREVVINVDRTEVARLRVGGTTPLVKRPGALMSQAVVEERLRERLAELGGHVEWNTEVGDLAYDGWIVGCDGAHSAVRKLAGIGFPGVPLIERFLVADIHADLPLSRNAVHTCVRGNEMFGLFPLPGADLWRILTPEQEGRELGELLAEYTAFPATAIKSVDWVSTFRIHRRLAYTYRSGRVLLAGDAAHIHSPFGGQGMNTGLGDAENLAWKLALVDTGRAAESLLDTYEAERRPIAVEVLSNTSSMTGLMLGRNAPARLVRDHVVVPLMNRPFVQRRIAEASSQLRISYRGGPLGSAYPRRGLRSGDRVPDQACTRPDGTPATMLGEMLGRWVLLTSDDRVVRAVGQRLGDAVVTLRPEHDRTLLVRPDGHLAVRGDVTEVMRWLDHALGRSAERAAA